MRPDQTARRLVVTAKPRSVAGGRTVESPARSRRSSGANKSVRTGPVASDDRMAGDHKMTAGRTNADQASREPRQCSTERSIAAISSPARKSISAVTTGPSSILPQFGGQPRSVFYAAQFLRLLGQNADGRFAFVAKFRDARTDACVRVIAGSNPGVRSALD